MGGGGSKTVSKPDYGYNIGLLRIQQGQYEMEQQFNNFYLYGSGEMVPTNYNKYTGQATEWDYIPDGGASARDVESANIQTAFDLQPLQADLERSELEAAIDLQPLKTGLERSVLEEAQTNIDARAPVRAKFYDETMKGLDVGRRTALAAADVGQQYDKAGQSIRNQAFRNGVDPLSGNYKNMQKDLLLGRAKDTAIAMGGARDTAEEQNWQRLASASTAIPLQN